MKVNRLGIEKKEFVKMLYQKLKSENKDKNKSQIVHMICDYYIFKQPRSIYSLINN